MTYDGIVQNACAILQDNGVQFDSLDLPQVFMEEDLIGAMNMYVGAYEAEEVGRQLVIASMKEGN